MKIASHGIGGNLLTWIEAFLTGRLQRVTKFGVSSNWSPGRSGIPQGGVLGPFSFVIFRNDLPESIKNLVFIFDDNTKIMRPLNNHEQAESFQDDLDKA